MSSEGQLQYFTSGDVEVVAIRDNIVNDISTKLTDDWIFDGHNTWTKQAIDNPVEALQNIP